MNNQNRRMIHDSLPVKKKKKNDRANKVKTSAAKRDYMSLVSQKKISEKMTCVSFPNLTRTHTCTYTNTCFILQGTASLNCQ